MANDKANGKARTIKPEQCWRCGGTGRYVWGAIVNGKPTHEGDCFKCVGGGEFPRTEGAVLWRQQAAARRRAAVGLSETITRVAPKPEPEPECDGCSPKYGREDHEGYHNPGCPNAGRRGEWDR